jgi:hypothetical protein
MKSAICYLCKNQDYKIVNIKKSLEKLYLHYKFVNDSDIFIFVESDFPKEKIEDLKLSFPRIYFKTIEFKPSVDLKIPVESISFDDKCDFTLGYRHMCQFFFSEIRNYIKEYDWYMRLDDDSFIGSDINYNIFEYLENNNKVYGYVAEIPEWPPVVVGVDDFFIKIIEDYKLTPHFFDKLLDDKKYNLRHFYNNIEVAKLSYFEKDEVKLLTRLVNESGNIYRWRWGDNLLRTILLSITVDQKQIHKFEDFDYCHQWYKRENGVEMCFYSDYQLDLYNKWKNEGWLGCVKN